MTLQSRSELRITTQRCLVRGFVEADIEGFMRYRNDEPWMRFQGYKGRTRAQYLADLVPTTPLEQGAQYAIVDRIHGELIGDVYLRREADTFWIGFTVTPSRARQGYMLEVVPGVVEELRHRGCTMVKAGVMPQNAPSANLLTMLGFKRLPIDESDEHVYGLQLGDEQPPGTSYE